MLYEVITISALAGIASAMLPGAAQAESCQGDGTPNQFIPKKAPDANPLDNDIEKYPKCPYCGMDRKEHNRNNFV